MPTPTLNALRRKLECWELDHLRRHAAELAERLELTEEQLHNARNAAESWREDALELGQQLMEAGKTIGLTVDGQLGVIAAPPAFPAIELNEFELYAGVILGKGGEPNYHLILLPGQAENITWNEAREWAAQQGEDDFVATLPSRREQALLYANLKEAFEETSYWSDEAYEGESGWAWSQTFYRGIQDGHRQYGTLRARAVRRLII